MTKKRNRSENIGFVVESGPMSSLGSGGATFIGHGSTRDVSAYRSEPGEPIGSPERRFFTSGQEVTRDMSAWDIAPVRYLDGVLPASLTTQPGGTDPNS